MAIEPLGKRLARLRRAAGMRTAGELAERLPEGSGITTAMIQNLESGRRGDLSFSQMVLIAQALVIPVASLAVDLRDPFGESSVPGLTNWEVVQMMRGDHPPLSALGTQEYNRIFAIDELLRISRDWDRMAPIPLPDSASSEQQERARQHFEQRREHTRQVALQAYAVLEESETVDLTWAHGPWLGDDDGFDQAAP